ncbi:hypothetical protein [Mycobacteroides abscessus]|uniref:hypothetical protein n=1 Tax=Mycobacteroides abscessus TaxID=36809 RepID=UPI0012FFF208|nr:hypothetical protein [Mycobacteroides abscessus]
MATDGDALITEDGGNAGLGDAVAGTDVLRGLAGFIPGHDVGDVLGGEETLRAWFGTIPA